MNDDDPLQIYQKFNDCFNKITRNGDHPQGGGGTEGMTGTQGVYQSLDLDSMQYPAPVSQVGFG